MKIPSFRAGLCILCIAGSALKGDAQSVADTLSMEHYRVKVGKAMYTDRAGVVLGCDSMEQLAQRMDWAEKRVEVWLLRTENACIFADYADMSRCLQELDKLLPAYKSRLNEAAYTRFSEENRSFSGMFHYRSGNPAKALSIYLDLVKTLREKPGPPPDIHERLFALYQLIAVTYAAGGHYQKAIDYYLVSIENRQGFAKKTMHHVNALYQIGDIYGKQGHPGKATECYMQALDSLNKAIRADGPGKWFGYATNLHRRLGLLYADQAQFNLAFEHFQNALAYAKPGTQLVATIHDNLGATYGKINLPAEALDHLRLSIDLKSKMYGKKSENVAETTLLIGEIYQCQGDYAAALAQCQNALGMLCNEALDSAGYNNPLKDPAGRQQLFLRALSQKLDILSGMSRQNPADTGLSGASRETWQIAFRLMDKMRGDYMAASDKQYLADYSRPLYETAIGCILRRPQDRDENPFFFAEKTKSLLLYEGALEAKALQYGGIPDTLLQKEYALRRDIALYDEKRFKLEIKGALPTDSALLAFSSRLFALRHDYEILKKTFETDYPDYYRLKYGSRVEEVASVQRDLLYPDMALVEYFVGDSAVFIFRIGKTDYEVLEVKKDFPLETWVAQLHTGLTAFQTDTAMEARYDSLSRLYAGAACNIYQKLVAPIAAKLPKKIIILPDGVLGYVPFEVLLTAKPENPTRWNSHRYLLNNHSVSYCYSATMLREMLFRRHKRQPDLNFLGFAPAYDGDTVLLEKLFPYDDDMRKDLRPLPSSGEEVYRIARMMKGRSVVGKLASKERFTEQAGRARILHLAAHARADSRAGDYSFIVFAEQKDSLDNEMLYARDIYNLQLNADLVTLSACETGIGELQGGEGIISLARAFAYAGSKSIVTSLWSVSDIQTKDLMLGFYKNLRKGMLKDDALRQAKLDFLKRNRAEAAHPFYWAGFVGIGNMGKLRRD